MKGILSLFFGRQKRREKNGPEQPMVLPSVPEPDLRDGEDCAERTDRADGPEEDAAGPIRRITEFIRNLAVRAEETIREVTGPGAAADPAGEEGRVREDLRNFSSVLPGNTGTGEMRNVRTEAEPRSGSEADFTQPSAPGEPRGDAVYGGRAEFFSSPEFRAEVRDEDIPFRRGGFTGEASGERTDRMQESFRSLLERTEEMKEILSGLNETADEIRKELTI